MFIPAGLRLKETLGVLTLLSGNLTQNIESTIAFYNDELKRWKTESRTAESVKALQAMVDDFVTADLTQISWTHDLKQDILKGKALDPREGQFVQSIYRPFTKQWQYYSRRLNERVLQNAPNLPRWQAAQSGDRGHREGKQKWLFHSHGRSSRRSQLVRGGRSVFSLMALPTGSSRWKGPAGWAGG